MSETSKQTKIGKYEILEKIGEGGFGIVYRARDPLLDRDVAIKMLHANLAAAPDFVERFRREARLTASLHHPNIVGIIEVDENEGRYYLVMEYLAGQPLDKLLENGKPVTLNQVIAWLHPLADALDYAHTKGLIHRDIKPSNVIMAEERRPVLTDFGLVKSTQEVSTTTTGVVLGSLEYMAPEQIQGKEATPATDQYALGVVAYQMLTGRVPFQGKTPYEVQNGHVSLPPPEPRSINPALLPEVARVLLRVLEKDPGRRYPTCLAFVAELEKIAHQLGSQQSQLLMQEAKQQMEKMDFDGAITRLEQMQSIETLPEVATLLQECRRRKEIWDHVQELLKQKEQSGKQIDQILVAEKWIQLPVDRNRSLPSLKNRNKLDKGLFVSLVLLTLAAVVMGVNVGSTAPSQQQVDYTVIGSLGVHYGVSPAFLENYCIFVLALWATWLVYHGIAWLIVRSRK